MTLKNDELKKFIPHKTRPIRLSDKTWEELKKKKLKSGLNWDSFVRSILSTNQ